MPGGDGRGPLWGQGRWNCRRGLGIGFGRGYGRGFGQGYGRGYGFFGSAYSEMPQSTNIPQPTKDEEISELRSYANELKTELDEIKRKIKEREER